jgi:hypothetical protein
VNGRKSSALRTIPENRNQIYWRTCGTNYPLSGVSFMRVQANHWLDYDAVALAVLVFGISAVMFLALNL